MNVRDKVAVCSRSLSANKELRAMLSSRYRNVKFNDNGISLSGALLKEFIYDATKVIIGLENIDSDMLSDLPNLKVVSKYGVGIDMLDTEAFVKYGIRLGWTGGVNKRSVSETVILFSLALSRNLCSANNEVKSGIWKQNKGTLLTNKIFGIVGFGNIGKDLSELLEVFNCEIIIYDKFLKNMPLKMNYSKVSDLDELLVKVDFLSLHIPLKIDTRNIIGKREFEIMKNSAYLINTSRGGLVDEKALYEALKTKEIAGAASDVFNNEPLKSSPLFQLENFISTPHMAGTTEETILAMGIAAIEGLDKNEIPYNNKA